MKGLSFPIFGIVGIAFILLSISVGPQAVAGVKTHHSLTDIQAGRRKFLPDSLQNFRYKDRDGMFICDTVKQIHENSRAGVEIDDNFTYEKYAQFLLQVSDTSKYMVVPIEEFKHIHNPNKVVIGLRHDVDVDLSKAFDFSHIEAQLGFRSTYYILHTADYYLADPADKAFHNPAVLPILKAMQNKFHFEIGIHNDLVTEQLIYGLNPVDYLHQELDWLRSNGITITGSSSHGSNYCHIYNYLNYYFFQECTWPVVAGFENNIYVQVEEKLDTIIKGNLADFGLTYEAYFLDNNKYYSDAKFINGERWNFSMLDLKTLVPGDRAIFLTHPIHWKKNDSPYMMNTPQMLEISEQKDSSLTFLLASNVQWTIQNNQPWIQLQNLSGEGNQVLHASSRENPGPNSRTAVLTITGTDVQPQIIQITQRGKTTGTNNELSEYISPYLLLSRHLLEISEQRDSTLTFLLESNIKWTVYSNQPWIQVQSLSGEGNQVLHAVSGENTGTSSRTAVLTISGDDVQPQTIQITQYGKTTGINPELSSGFQVYPNPTSGNFFVSTGNKNTNSVMISVSDLYGKTWFKRNLQAERECQIDLSGVAAGTYLVRLVSGESVSIRKIVIR